MMKGLLHHNMLPAFELPASDGRQHRRREWYDRANMALFLLHKADCRACRDLLIQLGQVAARLLKEQETAIIPVIADTAGAAAALARELELPFVVLADETGALARRLLNENEQAALFLTDRFGAVMERHAGAEARLPTGDALLAAAQLVQFHCPECTIREWDDD